ncbi:hypothetical protein FQZ97_1101690 [compost metagenome]
MIVDKDDRGCRQFERALDDLARIDRRVVDGAGLLDLIGDRHVALVEEQDAELLLGLVSHRRVAIFDHHRPGREDMLLAQLALQRPVADR